MLGLMRSGEKAWEKVKNEKLRDQRMAAVGNDRWQ